MPCELLDLTINDLPNKICNFFMEGLTNIPKITLLIFIVLLVHFREKVKAFEIIDVQKFSSDMLHIVSFANI